MAIAIRHCCALLFLCSFIHIFIFASSLTSADSELKLVQVIFRHGDRNPINPYPNDPYKSESFWPEGYGQLTNIGKMQHYRLGQYIRSRYSGYLNEVYSSYEIYIRSSAEDRALMSAEANLAGLYPPIDAYSQWNDIIFWQPIPVHSEPFETDNKLKMKSSCPKYDKLVGELLESDDIKQINEENKDLFEYISKHTGSKIKSPRDLTAPMQALNSERTRNYPLPEWTDLLFPKYNQILHHLTGMRFKMLTYTHEMKVLKGGPLIEEILGNLVQKSTGTMDQRRKFFMFSAHDTTLACFLNSLGMFNDEPPPYASMVIVELRKDNETLEDYVEILYRNNTEVPPYVLHPPGCGDPCTLDAFTELANQVIPTNWAEQCQIS